MTITGADVAGFFAFCSLIGMHQDAKPLILQVDSTRAAGSTLVLSLVVNSWIWMMYGTLEKNTFVSLYSYIALLDAWEVFKLYRIITDRAHLNKLIGGATLLLVLATAYTVAGAYVYTTEL